jgi:lysophospholipase L1-like esterase
MDLRILCYGDSNTWGFSPRGGMRFPPGVRWPGVLVRCLGPGVTVLEEGLNGRTLLSLAPPGHPLNGAEALPSILKAHLPVELLILFLGINDLFAFREPSAAELAAGLRELLTAITAEAPGRPPQLPADRVVVLPPVSVNPEVGAVSLYRRQLEFSYRLAEEYARVARDLGCTFFDPGTVIASSALDGVHLEAEAHVRLGESLCAFLRRRYEALLRS